MNRSALRRSGIALVAVALTLLTACAPLGSHTNPMMPAGIQGGMGWRARHDGMGRLTCTAPRALPGTVVRVMVGDHPMHAMMSASSARHGMLHAVPASAPSGPVTFVVVNMGSRKHELVVLPLADGHWAGERIVGRDGRVDESGSLGEASRACGAGVGEGIRPHTVGWVTLTLPAGRNELICNLPHHYASGMHQLFVVR